MIKSTNYCDLLQQGFITDSTNTYKTAVEKIHIKNINQDEIRFSYYKKNNNGVFFLVPRPLDVTEDELICIIQSGIKNNVFSVKFLNNLKKLLNNIDLNNISTKNSPIKSTAYCDLYADICSIDTTNQSKNSIEKIFIKALNQFEIRFAYYKQNSNNNFNIVMRPLDLPEDELLILLQNSISEGIFSKVFILALTYILA